MNQIYLNLLQYPNARMLAIFLPFKLQKTPWQHRVFLFCTLMVLMLPCTSFGQDGQPDLTFNTVDQGYVDSMAGTNNDVRTTVIQPDGKIIIGGLFTSYNGQAANYITRLNTDGLKDATFNNGGSGANGNITKIILQADGKIVVAGSFTQYNGVTANSLMRLNSDGSRDTSFDAGTGSNGEIRALTVQADGKVIAGGAFTSFNSLPANYIVRLNINGSKDGTFNSNGSEVTSVVNAIAIQSNGRIVVGMNNDWSGVTADFITRLTTTGATDATFNSSGSGANGSVRAIAIQPDGKIIFGGLFNYNGSINNLARIAATGAIDGSFTNLPDAYYGGVQVITLQADGKLLIGFGEYRTGFQESEGKKIRRLNTNGTEDTAFKYFLSDNLNENVYAISVQPNGKILVAESLNDNHHARTYLLATAVLAATRNFKINRYNADGTQDEYFCLDPLSKGAGNIVYATVPLANGKSYIGGRFYTYNGEPVNYFARLNADGSRDLSFNAGGTGPNCQVNSIVVQNDGKIIIAGIFSSYNGTPANLLIRLNTNGSIDPSFNAAAAGFFPGDTYLHTLLLQPDGKILVGLSASVKSLIRLNTDGSPDAGFNAAFASYLYSLPFVYSIALQANGKILAGGSFTRLAGNARISNIVRFNTNGSRDSSFNPKLVEDFTVVGANGAVNAIAVQADGKIIIGGLFTGFNTYTTYRNANRIMRLNLDGTPDATFNVNGTGANGEVNSIVLLNGKIFVGGNFTNYNGAIVNRLMRLNADGSLDNSFNVNRNGANANIKVIAVQPNGKKFFIGGSFNTYNGTGRTRIARIYNCTPSRSGTNVVVCPNQLPYSWNGTSYSAAGNYTKIFASSTGCDSIATLSLSISAADISGPVRACGYTGAAADTAFYTIAAPAGSAYTWSVSKPATMTILTGQGTNRIGIRYQDAFTTGIVYAKVTNTGCNFVLTRSLNISKTLPSTPGGIIASTGDICPFIGTLNTVRYTIPKISGATSYNWTAQAGTATILHPNGTGESDTTVTVSFAAGFTSSAISVQAVNSCGISNTRNLTINRKNPAIPGAVTGPTNVCMFTQPYPAGPATYSVPAGEYAYNWTVPAGVTDLTGQGTNTISFTYPENFSNGSVKVTAMNGCGTSVERSLTVKKLVASTPGIITAANTSTCPARIYSYTIASYPLNAEYIVWTVPAGATIISGDGTTSISVSYPAGSVSGFVTVRAGNYCSSTVERKLAVNLPACPPSTAFTRNGTTPEGITKTIEPELITGGIDVNTFPNPTTSSFNLKVISSAKEPVSVRLFDVAGRVIREFTMAPHQTIVLGADLKAGTYMAEVRQGKIIKTTRVIKF